MNLRSLAVVIASMSFVAAVAQAAETLVVAEGAGVYKPGLAQSWSVEGDKVTFVLAPDADGKQIASELLARLPGAKVDLAGKDLVVSGVAPAALLEQLALLLVGGGQDPLASLAALGGTASTGEQLEAGGSIRASKPTPVAALFAAEPDANDKYEAQVMEVSSRAYPEVALKLKIRRAATASAAAVKLAAGRVVECTVLLARSKRGEVDFTDETTRRNLGAYYLKKGDRVLVRFAQDGERLVADWIARK